MEVDYIFDQTNTRYLTDIKVNGKSVKRSSVRGFRKASETPYFAELTENRVFANPFSGVEVELTPLEGTIYNWCVAWYSRYERNREAFAPIQTYDDMKYFLLEINPNAYMDLID